MTTIEPVLTDPQKVALREYIGIGEPNAANGFLQLDEDGNAAGSFQQLTGTDAEINAVVLANGQIAYTTDTLEVRMGDGVTAGGKFISGGRRTATSGSAAWSAAGTTLNATTGRYIFKNWTLKASVWYDVYISLEAGVAETYHFHVGSQKVLSIGGPWVVGQYGLNGVTTTIHFGNSFNSTSNAANVTTVAGDKVQFKATFKSHGTLPFLKIETVSQSGSCFGYADIRRIPDPQNLT